MTDKVTMKRHEKPGEIEITLKNVRLSFVSLFDAKVYKDKKTGKIQSYSQEVNVLLDKVKDADVITAVKELQREAIKARFGDNPPTIPADNRCLRDGEIVDPDTGVKQARWVGYDGKVFISASKKHKKPLVEVEPSKLVQLLDGFKGADGKFPRLKPSDGKLYSGVYADVILRIYAYDGRKDENPNRVNASLEAVKFRRHGDAFGAAPVNADDLFEENETDDDDFGSSRPAPAAKSDDDDLM